MTGRAETVGVFATKTRRWLPTGACLTTTTDGNGTNRQAMAKLRETTFMTVPTSGCHAHFHPCDAMEYTRPLSEEHAIANVHKP